MTAHVLSSITLSLLATASPLKLAAPGFQTVNIRPELAAFFTDHLAQQMELSGIHIITASEINTVIGVAKQRELLSCNEASNCIAELGNALGVDAILVGSLARFDTTFQLNLKVLDPKDAHVITAHSATVEGEKAVMNELNSAALKLTHALKHIFHREEPGEPPTVEIFKPTQSLPSSATQATTERVSASSNVAWIPTVAGAALVLGGAGCLLKSYSDWNALSSSPSYAQAVQARDDGKLFEILGIVLASVGVAGLGVGGALWLGDHASSAPHASLVVTSQSARLFVTLELP